MSVIKHCLSLPKGRLAHVEHMPAPDDYRGMKTDDFIALAESHARLLKVVYDSYNFVMEQEKDPVLEQRLTRAIEVAEKI